MEGSYSSSEDAMSKIFELKKSKTLCDVIIAENSYSIYAHSCVLAAKSTFFLDHLTNISNQDWCVKTPLNINLTALTKCNKYSKMNCASCASNVIDFMYTGNIIIESAHVDHLLRISCNLGLIELKEFCKKFSKVQNNKLSRNASKEENNCSDGNTNCNSEPFNFPNLSSNRVSKCSTEVIGPVNKVLLGGKKAQIPTVKVADTKGSEHKNCTVESVDVEKNIEVDCTNKSNSEFKCNKCKFQFSSMKMVEEHKKVFHRKHFICLSCNFTTLKLSHIVFHLLNMNHEENCCSICLFEAPDKFTLKKHFQDHKNDYPFKCYHCGISFRARTEWLRHALIYNLQKPLSCKLCGNSFMSKHDLTLHMLTHRDTSNHVCDICGFIANYKSVLQRHCLKHKKKKGTKQRFLCPVSPCSFSSDSKSNLKSHIASHGSIKSSVICHICSLKFTQAKNLKRHIKTVHNEQNDFYKCCRCSYKNARIDKVKAHCETLHPNDDDAVNYVVKQHTKKKDINFLLCKKECENPGEIDCSNTAFSKKNVSCLEENVNSNTHANKAESKLALPETKKTFVLSETTGEFHIISGHEGEQIPVASVTSTSVLTIGNFREGTGSVTLNEATGVLTLNNINSESTGAVFLNESTGELSYINLGKDALNIDVDNNHGEESFEVETQLNEVTGEIFTVNNEKKISDFNENDALFDSFDMDIGNEDSCDGFDDLDGLLFDSIDVGNSEHLELFMPNHEEESLRGIPHLNETTGELSFDYIESQDKTNEIWPSSHTPFVQQVRIEGEPEDSYTMLLNEVTGEFS